MLQNYKFIFLFMTLCYVNLSHAQHENTILVFFNTDQYHLSHEEQLKLNDLDTINIEKISIQAFCDDRGTNQYNTILSTKRANHIKDLFMRMNGNNLNIQKAIGNGELSLLEENDKTITQQRAYNRRAEIIMTYKIDEKTKARNAKIEDLLKNLEIGNTIVLENILFVGGRNILLPESNPSLEFLLDFMKRNTTFKISILGHICCKPVGEDGLDLETGLTNLSIVRAKTIYDYLIENGIDSERLSYEGLKADFPTGKDVKYDRRVEIKVIHK